MATFGAPVHAYTIYNDLPTWLVALNAYSITTDSFSNDISSNQSIQLDSGITSTNSGPAVLPNPPFNNNSVASGVYGNAVQAGAGTASNTITWAFPGPVVAFGADFLSANVGALTLNGDFDGLGVQSILVNDSIGGSNGFLGVIGTAPFSSVSFSNATTTVDSFSMDNASFAPVPGPLPALGATAAFGWSRQLRRRIAGLERASR
ncbi:MAG: PEP-CTERM sorting domain-containing protein [Cyanobacteriota bacterium]|nr:PEP-CTERM sorting domain-containing protein [Cyanobacteriota bacterium]